MPPRILSAHHPDTLYLPFSNGRGGTGGWGGVGDMEQGWGCLEEGGAGGGSAVLIAGAGRRDVLNSDYV